MSYQKKLEVDNYNAWLHGQYIRLAVGSVLDGKKCKYPLEPFTSNKAENAFSGEERFLLWIEAFNVGFEEN
nr:MAG TPA: hypothetical protein [Bacteriophage sp.]